MSLPLITRQWANQDSYVWMLQSAYRAGYRVPDPDFATAQDADIWQKIRRDPDIAAAMNTRLHGVACRDWTIQHRRKPDKKEKLCGLVTEDAMHEIKKFTTSRKELAHAVIRGSSWGWVVWRRKYMRLGPQAIPKMSWLVPVYIKDIDRRRFRYGIRRTWDPETEQERLETPLEFYSMERAKWERVPHDAPLISVSYGDSEDRLGYGEGLLEALYFYHWLKGKCLEEGMVAVERLASGMLVLGIDGLRDAEYNRSNDAIRSAVISALKKFRSRHVLVKDKTDDLDLKETSGAGSGMVLDFIHELNRAMRVLILGSDLPFGGSRESGSQEMAGVQKDVSEALIQFDRDILDEAVTDRIIQPFFWRNRRNFEWLGCLGGRLPRFASIQEPNEDPEKAMNVFATGKQNGLSFRREEVYKRTGWTPTDPEDPEEDIIEGDSAPVMSDLFGGTPGSTPPDQEPGEDNQFGKKSKEEPDENEPSGFSRKSNPPPGRGKASARNWNFWVRLHR